MKSKKKIKKSIDSYDKIIEEHEQKIEKFKDEKPWLKNYWKNQIKEFKHQKEKEKRKLEK